MDRKNLVILIIVAIVFFVVGGGVGVMYQNQMGVVPANEAPKIQAVQTLSSKVIPSITAFGQVSSIEGKDVTLTFGGDSLKIKVRDDAQIYLPATSTTDQNGKPVTSAQQTAKFSDIKVGDNVSVNLKLLPDGQIEGQMVIIITAAK
jgi:hypothetical protein